MLLIHRDEGTISFSHNGDATLVPTWLDAVRWPCPVPWRLMVSAIAVDTLPASPSCMFSVHFLGKPLQSPFFFSLFDGLFRFKHHGWTLMTLEPSFRSIRFRSNLWSLLENPTWHWTMTTESCWLLVPPLSNWWPVNPKRRHLDIQPPFLAQRSSFAMRYLLIMLIMLVQGMKSLLGPDFIRLVMITLSRKMSKPIARGGWTSTSIVWETWINAGQPRNYVPPGLCI